MTRQSDLKAIITLLPVILIVLSLLSSSNIIQNVEAQYPDSQSNTIRQSNTQDLQNDSSPANIKINLSNDTSADTDPGIVTSGNNVYVTWLQEKTGSKDVLFRRSTDNGTNFGPTIRLSDNTHLPNLLGQTPQVAVSENNVYVVWSETNNGMDAILLKRSTDGGASFSNTINVAIGKLLGNLQLALSGNNVFIVWTGQISHRIDAVFFKRSTDGGASFGHTIIVSNNSEDSYLTDKGSIATSGNNVYLVWSTLPDGEILVKKSTDNGTNFGETTSFGKFEFAGDPRPQISAFGPNVYVIWNYIEEYDLYHLLFKKSTDNGNTFGDTMILSEGRSSFVIPLLDAYGKNVFVIWRVPNPDLLITDIFLTKSKDNGTTFGDTIQLNDYSRNSGQNSMDVSGDNLYVVWVDRGVNNEKRDGDIIFMRAN